MKFGGTSVGNSERIMNAANIIKSNLNKKPVVVVSAVAKITDALIKHANESAQCKGEETLEFIKKLHYDILEKFHLDKHIIEDEIVELENLAHKTKDEKKIDRKALDHFQSFGERMSSKIIAAQLNKIGVNARAFNSWELGFFTDSQFGNAEPLKKAYPSLKENIGNLDILPVVTGFIGKTENGDITTLGRGGSDYTAAIIGAAINAEEIQIWTDVDGIMSTDPKIVPNAKTIREISFAEASELAFFGAKVLHPKTILPAMDKNIPVKVLNTFNPFGNGTTILSKAPKSGILIIGIAFKKNITLINVESSKMVDAHGFMARFFNIFDLYKKSIDIISTSVASVSLTIDNEENIDEILSDLKDIAIVEVLRNKAIICVVGEGMRNTPGISGRTFTAMGNKGINVEMISQGASEINITFIVDGKDADKAVKVLHEEYFG